MGNCLSGDESEHAKYWRRWKAEFQALELCENDIIRLHKDFKVIETSKVNAKGTVLLADVLKSLGNLDTNAFFMKMFSIYDTKEVGLIDFRQFVYAYTNVCSLSHKSLVKLAFDVYNPYCHPRVSPHILKQLIEDIHGPIAITNEKAQIIVDTSKEKLMTYQDKDYRDRDFIDFCHLHPSAFSPAYDIQEKIQCAVFGLSFWQRKIASREENFPYRNLKDLVEVFTDFNKQKTATPEVSDDKKPKLTLKSAAPVHPGGTGLARRGSKEGDGLLRRGSKEGDALVRRGSKEHIDPAVDLSAAGFVMPKKGPKPVDHIHVESNFKSVASVELHRKSFAPELHPQTDEEHHHKHHDLDHHKKHDDRKEKEKVHEPEHHHAKRAEESEEHKHHHHHHKRNSVAAVPDELVVLQRHH